MPDAPHAATQKLIAALWLRSQPMVFERLAILDRAAGAAAENSLAHELREQAIDTAHKLAGSLGMFGFPQGSTWASEIEVLLDGDNVDALELTVLATKLRRSLFPSSN